MQTAINRFNVRVYFLLIDKEKGLLVSDEIIRGKHYTKFPGGGLEFGESTLEGAMRESIEELGQAIEVTGHFYTTDIFVQSRFTPSDQVLAIYYKAKLKEEQRFKSSEKRFDFKQLVDNEESFRWIPLRDLNADDFSFPSDKIAVKMLMDENLIK